MEQPLWILSGQQHAFIYVPIVACGLLDIAVTITEGIEDLHRNTDVVAMKWVFLLMRSETHLYQHYIMVVHEERVYTRH